MTSPGESVANNATVLDQLSRLVIAVEHSYAGQDRLLERIEALIDQQIKTQDDLAVQLRIERIRATAWETEARRLARAAGVHVDVDVPDETAGQALPSSSNPS